MNITKNALLPGIAVLLGIIIVFLAGCSKYENVMPKTTVISQESLEENMSAVATLAEEYGEVSSCETFELQVPYEIDGVSIYEYPLNCKDSFSISSIIYYTDNAAKPLFPGESFDNITVVSNLEELANAVALDPFAAIIISDGTYTSEMDKLFTKMIEVCYPIIIRDVTEEMQDENSAEYQVAENNKRLAFLTLQESLDWSESNFCGYIMRVDRDEDPDEENFIVYTYSASKISTYAELLKFCDSTKECLLKHYGQRIGNVIDP